MKHDALVLVLIAGLAGLCASSARAEERCLDYAGGKRLGTIDDKRLREASGLAASELQPGVLWSHNDSGAESWLYALDESGEILNRFEVDLAAAIDWEDVALGPCGAPDGLRDCLFVADTGDNDGERDDQTIYRVVEPDAYDDAELTEPAEVMGIVFEDAHEDVEALFVDQQGALWLVGKRDDGAALYRVGRFEAETTVVAELVAERRDLEHVTGADATADGTRIVLRSGDTAWELYRPRGRSVKSAFLGEALAVDLDKEAQGEAIAYDPEGAGFYTTSEGKKAPLRWYRCKAFGPTLTGKEDGGGLVADPAEPHDDGCASGGVWEMNAVLIVLGLVARARRRSRRS